MIKENTTKRAGIIGLTLQGMAWAVTLAKAGVAVYLTDMDEEVVNSALEGSVPGEEPGLREGIAKAQGDGSLKVVENLRRVIRECPVIFITAMVPTGEDNRPNARFVEAIARQIANTAQEDRVIVIRSLVTPGTAAALQGVVDATLAERELDTPIRMTLVSMPELYVGGQRLKVAQGRGVLPLGCDEKSVPVCLTNMVRALKGGAGRIHGCTTVDAEMAAFAWGGLEALTQAYLDGVDELCSGVGSEGGAVLSILNAQAEGVDYTHTGGAGFGGEFLPVLAQEMVALGGENHHPQALLKKALLINEGHTKATIRKILRILGKNKDKGVAILGLSPVPHTDDLRNAPSLEVVRALVAKGVTVKLYLPHGADQAKWRLYKERDAMVFCDTVKAATTEVDALLILGQFKGLGRLLTPALKKRMGGKVIVDVVGALSPRAAEHLGFQYYH